MRAATKLIASFGLLLAGPLHAACGVHSDFLVRSDPTLAPVRPTDCATVTQSPPEFTWPPQNGSNVYQVIVHFPGGRAESRTTSHNWLLWDTPLAPGTYAWQVKVSGDNRDTSDKRTFTIAQGAIDFVVPPAGAIVRRARQAPHPRTWSRDSDEPLAAAKAERRGGLSELLQEVDDHLRDRVQEEPRSESKNANYEDTVSEQKRTLAAAFAWAATHQGKYGADAARRLMEQARWSTMGSISYFRNDMASRDVAWTLALGYDWAYDYLSAAQKRAILAAIRARTQPMFEDIVARISTYPYDSHGNLTLGIVAAIGALTAGDIPEADNWLKEALPMAVVWTSPWGWQDGGFANGTTQGFWDTGSNLLVWYIFRNAAGVDLAKKEWVRNHGRWMAYFVPPGTPSSVFGDGQELNLAEVWSRISKAYAHFVPSPLSRWYASQWNREDASRLELLLAPRNAIGSPAFPAGTPNAAQFPSIGWVAMHSSLDDPMRASIYFKSSPYGSYNHSHGDQNSFVLNYKGRRLAIASGYYDDYGTKHWNEWYKQTRSANAITFDGGQGQGFNDKKFAGTIERFESAPSFDYAIGRAEAAYDGALTRARRTIVYLHPDVILVHDALASATPRAWEWNIHALNRIGKASERAVALRNGPAQMCVEMLAGPEVVFHETDRFTAPPSGRNMPNQWHGTFAATSRSPAADFVVLMRLGSDCSAPETASAERTRDGWNVHVDGHAVALGNDRVTVD